MNCMSEVHGLIARSRSPRGSRSSVAPSRFASLAVFGDSIRYAAAAASRAGVPSTTAARGCHPDRAHAPDHATARRVRRSDRAHVTLGAAMSDGRRRAPGRGRSGGGALRSMPRDGATVGSERGARPRCAASGVRCGSRGAMRRSDRCWHDRGCGDRSRWSAAAARAARYARARRAEPRRRSRRARCDEPGVRLRRCGAARYSGASVVTAPPAAFDGARMAPARHAARNRAALQRSADRSPATLAPRVRDAVSAAAARPVSARAVDRWRCACRRRCRRASLAADRRSDGATAVAASRAGIAVARPPCARVLRDDPRHCRRTLVACQRCESALRDRGTA